MVCMKSCGCCSLKAGCYTVAAYGILSAALAIFSSVYELIASSSTSFSICKLALALVIFTGSVCLLQAIRTNSTCLSIVWLVVNWIKLILLVGAIVYYIVTYVQLLEASTSTSTWEMQKHVYGNITIDEARAALPMVLVFIIGNAVEIILTIVSLTAVSSYYSFLTWESVVRRETVVKV